MILRVLVIDSVSVETIHALPSFDSSKVVRQYQ